MRHVRTRLLVAAMFAVTAAGCGLEVRTSRTAAAAAPAMEGEWVGSWQPVDASRSGGPLTIRLQQFLGEPVVSLAIDNPCLPPRDYELQLLPTTIRLLADGVLVFGADVAADQSLLGTYQCASGTGTWSATRQRSLPAIVDLSGSWRGNLEVPGTGAFEISLDLQQSVRAGALALSGDLRLPELLPAPMPALGTLRFREGAFDLILRAADGAPIQFVVSGIGELAPPRLETGIVQFFGPSPLPFSQGLVRITRQTPP